MASERFSVDGIMETSFRVREATHQAISPRKLDSYSSGTALVCECAVQTHVRPIDCGRVADRTLILENGISVKCARKPFLPRIRRSLHCDAVCFRLNLICPTNRHFTAVPVPVHTICILVYAACECEPICSSSRHWRPLYRSVSIQFKLIY